MSTNIAWYLPTCSNKYHMIFINYLPLLDETSSSLSVALVSKNHSYMQWATDNVYPVQSKSIYEFFIDGVTYTRWVIFSSH